MSGESPVMIDHYPFICVTALTNSWSLKPTRTVFQEEQRYFVIAPLNHIIGSAIQSLRSKQR